MAASDEVEELSVAAIHMRGRLEYWKSLVAVVNVVKEGEVNVEQIAYQY